MEEFKVSPTYDCPGGVGVEDEELGLEPRDLVDGLFTLMELAGRNRRNSRSRAAEALSGSSLAPDEEGHAKKPASRAKLFPWCSKRCRA